MPTEEPVKIALFGAGLRGELDLGHFVRKLHKELRFSAVAECDPERRARFVHEFRIEPAKAYADWKDLLAGPRVADAILNCLPCNLHHESTVAVLRAGYPVLMEKPIAHDLPNRERRQSRCIVIPG